MKSKEIKKKEKGHKYNLSKKKLDEIIARSESTKKDIKNPINIEQLTTHILNLYVMMIQHLGL